MNWVILAAISVITVSVATLLERVMMKEDHSDPIGYAIVFQFALAVFSLVFAILFNRFTLPSMENLTWRFAASAFLWAGSTVFGLNAFKRLGAGEVTILMTGGTLISIVLGVLFLGESFGIKAAAGTALILVSIGIVNGRRLTFSSRKGVLYSFLSAACSGIAVVNDAFILKSYDAFSYTAIMSFLPAIVIMAFFPNRIAKAKPLLNLKNIKLISVFGFFYSIQAITYYLAFQGGAPVSQLSPIMKSSIILTVLLGVIFLKERKDLGRKIIASTVVTIGAILLG